MEIIRNIFSNTSLWEVIALAIVIYLMFKPSILRRITRVKVGELELELESIKKEVKAGKDKIAELESEIEHDKRFFDSIIESFDPHGPVSDLSAVRQQIKSQAHQITDLNNLRTYLNMEASPSELYVAAVSIREKRPVSLLHDIIELLDQISKHKNLGNFRLNTVWTLVSCVHRILIASIRDDIPPQPSNAMLNKIVDVLQRLELHTRVQNDRPDDPMKGIRGPIKWSLDWVAKAREKNN